MCRSKIETLISSVFCLMFQLEIESATLERERNLTNAIFAFEQVLEKFLHQ